MFKISTGMFVAIDEIFNNHHFNRRYLHYPFYCMIINKLQPLSYQSTPNITPPLPLHTSQPTHKINTTTALLTQP